MVSNNARKLLIIFMLLLTIAWINLKVFVNNQQNINFTNQSLFPNNQTFLPLIQNKYNYTRMSINTNSSNISDAIVILIQNRYNYMDTSIKRLNTNSEKYATRPAMNNPRPRRFMKFQRLPQHYAHSIKYFQINQTLTLPNNISFFIIKILGQGAQSKSFLVNSSTDYYALKLFHNKRSSKNAGREYTILKTIEQYCTYFNLSQSLLNIPFADATIPAYYIPTSNKNKPRFFFIRAIFNAMKLSDLMNTQKNNKSFSIIHQTTDMNSFFVNCYTDIMNTFYALYDIKAFHNDMTETNILIDYKTFKCYLIDFGKIFFKKISVYSYEKYKCRANTCSPLGHYYLTNIKKRKNFTKYYDGNNWPKIIGKSALDMLSEFAMYDKQYQITSLMLQGFIQLNYEQNSSVYRMNNEIYALRYEPRGMYVIWCKRLKILTLLRKEENKISDKFWKLLSIFENDWMFMNTSICF
eukprot:333000_1